MNKYDNKRTQKRSVTFDVGTLEQLDKLATRQHTTTSALVRDYIRPVREIN